MKAPEHVGPDLGEPETWLQYPIVEQLILFVALALLKEYRQQDPDQQGLDHYEKATWAIGFTLPHELDPFHVERLVLKVEHWLDHQDQIEQARRHAIEDGSGHA